MNLWPAGFTAADRAMMTRIAAGIDTLTTKLEQLMTEDATVAATAADIEADVIALKTAIASSAALIASLQAEVAAGTASVSPATMDALAQAKTDLDAVAAPPAA